MQKRRQAWGWLHFSHHHHHHRHLHRHHHHHHHDNKPCSQHSSLSRQHVATRPPSSPRIGRGCHISSATSTLNYFSLYKKENSQNKYNNVENIGRWTGMTWLWRKPRSQKQFFAPLLCSCPTLQAPPYDDDVDDSNDDDDDDDHDDAHNYHQMMMKTTSLFMVFDSHSLIPFTILSASFDMWASFKICRNN